MKATSTPAPRFPSGVLSASPAIRAITALDASIARAMSSVIGKIDSTFQMPIVETSTIVRRLRKLKVVRRRATTAGSVSACRLSQASYIRPSTHRTTTSTASQMAAVTRARTHRSSISRTSSA